MKHIDGTGPRTRRGPRPHRAPAALLCAAVALLATGPAATAAQASTTQAAAAPSADGEFLTLTTVLGDLRARNPRLQAARHAAEAERAGEPTASTLPDPVLQIGAMNLAVPDFDDDMAMSMAPAVNLTQPLPFPGKLGLRGRVAELATARSRESADETWWTVRTEAARHFYDLYALDRQIDVMRSTLDLLEDFQSVARSLYAAGSGNQADVLTATVEVARLDGDIRRMEASRTATAARLNALLARSADAPVPTPVLGELPAEPPSRDTLLAWARDDRPLLRDGRLGVEQADTRTDLARKDIWPDLNVGLQYGQRDRGSGVERMAGLMVGFSLPVWAGRRQHAQTDRARASARAARARLTELDARVQGRIGELLAELDRARSLVDLYRAEVLPQARATVESALSSYRVGSVDFTTLVDAQMNVNRFQSELYALLADHGKAVAGLEAAVGRVIPARDEILTDGEER